MEFSSVQLAHMKTSKGGETDGTGGNAGAIGEESPVPTEKLAEPLAERFRHHAVLLVM